MIGTSGFTERPCARKPDEREHGRGGEGAGRRFGTPRDRDRPDGEQRKCGKRDAIVLGGEHQQGRCKEICAERKR
jgi:hypothetical protein